MRGRHLVATVSLVLVVMTVGASGSSYGVTTDGPNATTVGAGSVTDTAARLQGRVTVGANATGVVVYFEYRPVNATTAEGTGHTDLRRTTPQKERVPSRGSLAFEEVVTSLLQDTTYEFRAVVESENRTVRGEFRTFTTDETGPSTATPDPCPEFRGAGSLCTRTPTPSPPPTGTGPPPLRPDDGARTLLPLEALGWLGGLVPLVTWLAAVAVVAPVVLGGLLGLDSLRGKR